MRVHDRMKFLARRFCLRQAPAKLAIDPGHQRPKRRGEQTFLVHEVVSDESRRNLRLGRDLRQSCAEIAKFCETIDRHINKKLAPVRVVGALRRGRLRGG
jgi:hypothetical protein